MKTSNFANWKHYQFPGAISISRYPDIRRGWSGPEFTLLFPRAEILRAYKKEGLPWNAYEASYKLQLDCLDPRATYNTILGIVKGHYQDQSAEPILLCSESAKTLDTNPCHRRLVAKWFESNLDIDVPEWSKES